MDVLVKAARSGRTAEALSALGAAAPANPPKSGGEVPSLAAILDRGFRRRGRT